MQRPRSQGEQGLNSVSEARGEWQEVFGNQSSRRAAAGHRGLGCSPWRCDRAGCASENDSSVQGGIGGPRLGDEVTRGYHLPREQ